VITNVLIPTDFSENSWNATRYALSFFGDRKCTFYLLHVNEISKVIQGGSTISIHENSEHRIKLQQLIQMIEASRFNSNHTFFALTATDTIVGAIRKEVENKHIDFIVMGTKGASGIKKIAVGSNTTDVISKVKCATLVVPENAHFTEINNIALPTDYNIFYGSRILETISDILNLHQAKMHIVHLAKSKESIAGEQLQNRELLQDYFMEDNHRFMSLTNKNLDKAIQECVDKHDIKLIAMVAKNIHFFQQIFFSSNTANTKYQKEIPFLVLHE
jgi:nucleotide-binding universal stress UspA family protein